MGIDPSPADTFGVPGYEYVRPLHDPALARGVVLARRLGDGAEVAVRVFDRPLGTARDRHRFEHEVAGLKALIDVPHILPLLNAGVTAEGQAYVVTPFCVAGSLWDHVLSVGRLTAAEVRGIGAKLAAALVTVHGRDIVHRNITPSTVLIDAGGEPVLAAFGLVAVSVSSGNFMPESGRERRPFLAPEAYLPELMTAATDIYALGATLYALLAGTTLAPAHAHPPIDGEHLVDLPRVPWSLMAVLRQAMALDPRDRYPRASALRSALLVAV